MNEETNMKEFSREEIREMAGETLKALGVETGELDDGEREVIRKAVEEWRRKKGKVNEGLEV